MRDPLESYLGQLPGETPAPGLAARIRAAVARRQRAQAIWRRIQALTIAAALAGLSLVLISWVHVADSLSPAWSAIANNDLAPAYNALATAPAETLAAWLDAGLAWHTAQAEDIGIMFTLGIALLSAAAFAGLARLLNAGAPGQYSR